MRVLAPAAFLLALHAPCALAACATSSEPWRGVLYDIDTKITLDEGPSAGSTYVPFADGAGVHLYADANLVAEADDNSFSSHTAVHEYIHLLQQAMLAGEITNTSRNQRKSRVSPRNIRSNTNGKDGASPRGQTRSSAGEAARASKGDGRRNNQKGKL